MHSQAVARTLVFLLAVCCLVPLAALGAVVYLAAPVWFAALVGFAVLALLGWRLMTLLAVHDDAGFPRDLPKQPGLWSLTGPPGTRSRTDSETPPGGSNESHARYAQ